MSHLPDIPIHSRFDYYLCAMAWSVKIMDLSPVQSGSKCNSDFSIERILSEDSRAKEDAAAAPSWLCCTRYQPPRIPRPSPAGNRARRSGRHARVPFTAAQASALEAAYARAPYLAPPALRALAAALHLRDDRIKIWFQNRRARERREKSTSITPPQAIALPATAGLPLSASGSWFRQLKTGQEGTSSTSGEIRLHQEYHRVHDVATMNSMALSYDRYSPPSTMNESSEESNERPESPLDIET